MEAVQWYDQGTKAEPNNAEGWAALGNAYLGAKMADDARRSFEKALSLDPANKTARQGLQILMQTKPSAN
jgi:cytochrome c-type biogenesis protein CcmH/NrfG